MDNRQFKKVFDECILSYGFSRGKGGYYSKISEDIICVIGLQKSDYSGGFYINTGYVIKQIHPSLDNPKDADGDIRTRFSTKSEGKEMDLFVAEQFEGEQHLQECLAGNLSRLCGNVMSLDGLKAMLAQDPLLLYQTSVNAKRVLGFE